MAYIDEVTGAVDGVCESCHISLVGTKIDTLMADITADPPVGYSGDLLEDSEIELLNNMCAGAYNVQFGDLLDGILTASQTYIDVELVSDDDKNVLNSICEGFRLAGVGTLLQNAAVIVNSMAEYDEANMLTFAIHGVSGATGTIGTNTIAVNVPYNTPLTNLVADFTVSDGAVVTVSGTEQTSGTSTQDYTNPVVFVVTSQTGEATKSYTTTITTLPNTASTLLTYSIGAASGVINDETKAVAVTVPNGTDVSALVATFTTSAQSTVKVGETTQTSASTANNFTSPVVYRVISGAGGDNYTDYTVTVTIAQA